MMMMMKTTIELLPDSFALNPTASDLMEYLGLWWSLFFLYVYYTLLPLSPSTFSHARNLLDSQNDTS
jgi:hypothetical protein